MKKVLPPSDETWRGLYAAAEAFKNLAPWKWMWDRDVVAVCDPNGDDVGYCIVLGRVGEFLGLEVILGQEGLEGYARLQAGLVDPNDIESLHIKNCLLASFEDRKFLDKNDLAVAKRLNLTFRGKDSWPKFRHFEPGLFPWHITQTQADFLTHCLEQVTEVAIRLKKSPALLEPKTNKGYFSRVCLNGKWQDRWVEPEQLRKVVVVRNNLDEEKIAKIFESAKQTAMTWEADYFWAPMPVRDGQERPYFPAMYMMSDHDSYFILDMQLEGKGDHGAGMGRSLLRAIEKHHVYPKKIIFRKPQAGLALGYYAQKFDIELKRVDVLKAINDAKREAFSLLKNR